MSATLGSGATMKLAVNLPLLVYWQALGEALTICKPLKLAPERLIDILSDTAGTPTAMKGRGAVIAKVLGGAPLGEPPSVSAPRKRTSPPRCNSPRRFMPSFRLRQAPLPASRKRKRPALAMPTPPRFRCAGRSSRAAKS